MANSLLTCFIFAAVIPFGVRSAKILSMRVNTNGYTLGILDKIDQLGLTFIITTYAKGYDCIKVMNIRQRTLQRSVDHIQISCEPANWSVTKSMVHYGNIVHIQTRQNKVAWAVFDLGDKCIQKTYRDRGAPQLGKLVLKLNRKECNQVVATQKPKRKRKGSASSGDLQTTQTSIQPGFGSIAGEVNGGFNDLDLASSSDHMVDEHIHMTGGEEHPEVSPPLAAPTSKEYQLLNKQKVVVLNANLWGFQRQGPPKTVFGRGFDFTVERYVKPGTGECVKLVTITKGGAVMDKVKISCEYVEPDKRRGFDLQIGSIIFEDPPFDMQYVIEGGKCLEREYFGGKIEDKILSEESCYKLTKRTKAQRISGIIPGTKPISPEDIFAMDNEIVAVLDGTLRGFKPQGSKSTFSTRTGLYQVEVQHYVKGNQCVKLVSFKRNDHDQYFDQVKLSCKIKGPVVTNDEDMELNYGNVIYIEDRFDAVFIMKGGECLKRDYFVFRNDVEKTDKKINLVNCFVMTRWKLAQRRTAVKLNKPAPPKTNQAPGLMWLLALNGDTKGYKQISSQNHMNGNSLSFSTKDFTKEDEECIRLVALKVYNTLVDTFKVACGPFKGMTIYGDYILYGKAFTFQPDEGYNNYKALFNLRDGSCVTRTYTVNTGYPVQRVQGPKVRNDECKALREGNGNMGGSISINGGSINIGGNNNRFTNNYSGATMSGNNFNWWKK